MHLGEENKGVDAGAVRFINWDRDVQEAVPPSNLNMNWIWLDPWSPSLFRLNLNVLHAFTSQLTAKSLCQLVTKFSRAPYKTCLSMRNLHQFVFLLLKNMCLLQFRPVAVWLDWWCPVSRAAAEEVKSDWSKNKQRRSLENDGMNFMSMSTMSMSTMPMSTMSMSTMSHGNVIFDILDPHAFKKYSTWWVFQALLICVFVYVCICVCICHCLCHLGASVNCGGHELLENIRFDSFADEQTDFIGTLRCPRGFSPGQTRGLD